MVITLKRNNELKIVRINIEMPANLALEMFSETGDLPIELHACFYKSKTGYAYMLAGIQKFTSI